MKLDFRKIMDFCMMPPNIIGCSHNELKFQCYDDKIHLRKINFDNGEIYFSNFHIKSIKYVIGRIMGFNIKTKFHLKLFKSYCLVIDEKFNQCVSYEQDICIKTFYKNLRHAKRNINYICSYREKDTGKILYFNNLSTKYNKEVINSQKDLSDNNEKYKLMNYTTAAGDLHMNGLLSEHELYLIISRKGKNNEHTQVRKKVIKLLKKINF